MDIFKQIINKINRMLPNKPLKLSEQEIKYIIKIWLDENYPDDIVKEITLYNYSDPSDPDKKEKIGAKILK